METVRYGVGSWKADGLGNHRAVVRVGEEGGAVRVQIPWRRRDREPEKKDIVVIDAATGERVENVVRVEVGREYGEIVFQPRSGMGEYYVYFMPFVQEGWQHMPSTRYLPPRETADAEWIAVNGVEEAERREELPEAEVVEIQAVNDFQRMDPMEVVATDEEVERLVRRYPGRAYLVFPEDRRYPIRMRAGLPRRWVETGPGRELSGTACTAGCSAS